MATKYLNLWLILKDARKIAKQLNQKYANRVVHEDEILDAMWNHPLYVDQMWLNVLRWRQETAARQGRQVGTPT